MAGWYGYAKSQNTESREDPAYSRATNAERFQPLHSAMLEILGRLENDFDVERSEGYGLDGDLERGLEAARPHVRLNSKDPE